MSHSQEEAPTLPPEADILDALELLYDREKYAIIVVEDGRPVGILTHYDMTRFFRSMSEGMMLVQAIEETLSQAIDGAFPDRAQVNVALLAACRPKLAWDAEPEAFARQLVRVLQEYFAALTMLAVLESNDRPARYFASGDGWLDPGPWRETDERRANTWEGGLRRTSAVGVYPGGAVVGLPDPTPLDTAGNVWEWTLSEYTGGNNKDLTYARPRVLRGGSWFGNLDLARAAQRFRLDPGDRNYVFGFRVVLAAPVS